MDFIKRKLSVKNQPSPNHGTNPSEPSQSVEKIDDSEYIRSADGTYTPRHSSAYKSSSSSRRRQQPPRAPGSFVKYGGPGMNAPGNVKHDLTGNAYGFGAGDVPPLPQGAHAHGDAGISDLERYRLQALSRDPVHEGPAGC